MSTKQVLRGFATISYWANDVEEAKTWYTRLLGIEPYFERYGEDSKLAYAEFRIGDYKHELGLIDRQYSPNAATSDPGGAVMFWHVDDIESTLQKLLSMGAKEYEPMVRREAGFITASVLDPFGNVLGIMYNPHYLEILNSRTKGIGD
ncbi:VOC family protein [Halalkalibacter sp. APA_J-10(15)]|uniref:VOC family protein n=1 Tax=Halalkalibacter sp. APA_J-10(15) TaxID=2933805 RepID=UPI001FF1DAD3|nr:VOC family protein [Halalkalibacter sp. APA_J-10(15)]MCK0473826.1 VOC family protein [Halalkalibacter sp. APA_J-10(15)]